jgi:hypothetical protein
MGVQRSVVIDVLQRALSPSSTISIFVTGDSVTIVKDGDPEVTVLPEYVPKKMLHRFQVKYEVRIEYFFHPEMLANKQNS